MKRNNRIAMVTIMPFTQWRKTKLASVLMLILGMLLTGCDADSEVASPPGSSVPVELVGTWVYSDDNGSWEYSFQSNGTYEFAFQTQQVLFNCTITIKRYEAGIAIANGSTLALEVGKGQKETKDSCESSDAKVENLAGTVEHIRWSSDGELLYLDELPLRRYKG